MPLTPDDVSNVSFPVVHRRGYDRVEVDRFLALVAEDYSTAIQKIAVAASGGNTTEEDIASEIGQLLEAARKTSQRIKDKAQAHADSMVAKAKADTRAYREAAENDVRERLEEADKERNDLLERARAHAQKTIELSELQTIRFAELLQERYGELLKHEKGLRAQIDALESLFMQMREQLEPLAQIDLTDAEELLIGEQEADEEVAALDSAEGSGV
ncbi:MAG: DivIVA domain-containing protein [Actinomycetota bacterium]